MLEKIDKLGSPRIMVIGGFMVDRYVWGDVERISPEAPVPVLRVADEEDRPGGAGRVLHALTTLGARAEAVGVIGEDLPGGFFAAFLRKLGVGTRGLIVAPKRRTTLKMRLMTRAGHAYRVDYDTNEPYGAKIENRITGYVKRSLSRTDALLISDYHHALPSDEAIRAIIRAARKAKVPVLVDPARLANYRRYRGATVLTPNRLEAGWATGMKLDSLQAVEKAADKLVGDYGIQAAVVTLDKEGVLVKKRRSAPIHIPTRPRAVYDVTGAGDEVLSVLGMALGARLDVVDGARLANAAAGVEVEKVGAVPVTLNELKREFADTQQISVAKLKTLEELVPIVEEQKRRGMKIAFTNGCFDLIHAGHISFLRFARSQGDLLIVGVNSDSSVRANKGPDRPIQGENERAMILASLSDVNYVVIFNEKKPLRLLRKLKPDCLIKGADWRGRGGIVGADIVESYGGRAIFAPIVKGLSTTNVIGKVLDKYGAQGQVEPDEGKAK